MTTVTRRLHLLEYEAEFDRGESLDRGEERFIVDAEVERLLLGASERAQRDREGESVLAIEAADDGDALAGMRGLVTGFAWMTLFWVFIAVIYWLA